MLEVSKRTVEPEDYEVLAKFLEGFEGEGRSRDFWLSRFQIWWDQNPFLKSGIPRGWILEDSSGVRGFMGNIPSLFLSNGNSCVTFNATTWRVHPEVRTESMRLVYALVEESAGSLLFNTTPSTDVKKILRWLHFSEWPSMPDGRASILFSRGKRKHLRLLGAVSNLGFAIRNRAPIGGEVRLIDPRDPALDRWVNELWERTKNNFSSTSLRNADLVRWFSLSSPAAPKYLLGYFDGDQLRGFSIFCRRDWPKKSVLEQLDLWTDAESSEESEKIISALVRRAKKLADETACDLIHFRHFSPAFARHLRRMGIWATVSNERSHFFTGEHSPLDQSKTYFSSIEGDVAL